MSTFVIGDVQGCYDELRALLDALRYDSENDMLWFVGDLVNRGPLNVQTLRFVRSLGSRAITVLGNHDLHLLAIIFGGQGLTKGDTFHDVLDSEDGEELAHWLRTLPLLHSDAEHLMTHAGVPHVWDQENATNFAREVERVIAGRDYREFFRHMYGNQPATWDDNLRDMDRLRLITNYFTRMRFIDPSGKLDFKNKTTLDTAPPGYRAWFEYATRISIPIVFGHWAALDGNTHVARMYATDTGCVWGRGLTALRLDDHQSFTWIQDSLVHRYIQ